MYDMLYDFKAVEWRNRSILLSLALCKGVAGTPEAQVMRNEMAMAKRLYQAKLCDTWDSEFSFHL
jgi:hypothetical protein